MSKTYICRVKRDLREVLREEDRVVYRVRLLPVADKEKMKKWFKDSLIKDGARENEDGTLGMELDGVKVEIDIDKEEVRVVSETGEEVNIKKDEQKKIYNVADNEQAAQKKAQEDVDNEVAQEIKEHRDRLRKKAVKALNEAEGKVKTKIRRAENDAIKKGLDEKAHGLGQVVDVDESTEGNGDKRTVWRIRLN